MFETAKKYRFLLAELVKKGIKLKYRRSYLGILWSLIEPIFSTIVLVIVFGTLFNNKEQTFPLYIITGRLIYSFFSEGTKVASKSIRANAGMIKKVYVPKLLYPFSTVVYNFVIFLISCSVLVGVDIYCKVIPTSHIFGLIPCFILLFLLTFSVGLFLATLNVFFRDVEYLWNVVLMVIMYMSAIFYYPDRLMHSKYSFILVFNPLFQVIYMARASVLGTPFSIRGSIYVCGVTFIMLGLSLLFYQKNKDKFILHL